MDERVYTVSEITQYIASLINDDPYLTDVQIVGEVVDPKERSGHLFFSLKDESTTIGCVMFGGAYRVQLEEGTLLQVRGDVRVYTQRGIYRLICKEVRVLPKKGILFLKLKEVYERLLKEGIFEKPKKAFPKFPKRVGVITSRDSAAYHDILRTARERFPVVKIILFHTRVQGEEAKESLLKAIEDANRENLDAVIIARGGGASDDLWIFNDEDIVRAVFKLRHPVVTGIGHQIDSVLVDLVADYSAHTPTAAVEYLLPDKAEIAYSAFENVRKMRRSLEVLIRSKIMVVQMLGRNLRVDVNKVMSAQINKAKSLCDRLYFAVKSTMDRFENEVQVLITKLSVLNPEWPLSRGYAIVSKGDSWIRSSSEVTIGDELVIRFLDGTVKVVTSGNRRNDARAGGNC